MDNKEKKEAFVKARFGEVRVFGVEEIESQFAGDDWKNYSPADLLRKLHSFAFAEHLFAQGQKKPFSKYMPELEKEELLKIISKSNSEFKEIIANLFDAHSFYPLFDSEILERYPFPPVVVAAGDKILKVNIYDKVEKVIFHCCSNLRLLEMMLIYAFNKDMGIIEKLIVSLRETIAEERKKAEADFDNAVAVSENGREIVCAEEVYVFWTDKDNIVRSIMKFPGESFNKDKIELICTRKNYAAANRNALVWARDANLNSAQVLDKQEPEKRVFITHGKYCPSPLPQGGEHVEIP